MNDLIHWEEHGAARSARWLSESGQPPAQAIQLADDSLRASTTWQLASEGTGLLWRGDWQNARNLLQAMTRRADHQPRKQAKTPLEAFNLHRAAQARRAQTLGRLLIEVAPGHVIPLRRAQDFAQAGLEAWGEASEPYIVSLRELLGAISAHEWRKKSVFVPALGAQIHPHYGVFSPVRGEYLDLVAQAPLPAARLAFDIGTGTGVIAALLARRGIQKVVATDLAPRALACAASNISRLGLDARVELQQTDLFPAGRAGLIVCNPPWLPAQPGSSVETAVYDPESRMLRGFLQGLPAHLENDGEGWLILSDLAEHLGLRTLGELQQHFSDAGLRVLERHSIRPRHRRVQDASDPLHAARMAEITSLWRLACR
ncbi:MAG: methyltransferase [Candidatus Dactylopiibacterium carminicum]|uniref:Methyltransferase n=1 Tax=Candidatus Dactylopiibacterium carminicum TaxID=857335 RepID=A0A272ET43_9RHOO|nr:class I SAM-dependent methyltransferase [Candidatus Dactylopiibacterium carminicum]KAF7599170.1 methyltransferase [Candidatus Dactylopiibacterium carminicum]PAS93258.1 MAG: methyltransferase [Candidatus Dactylopiibacterium carminicum]PAS97107.1 MAG: methyltransferase [Candidatus Dactylopiibacterium carminicum]PAS99184.1 MAG: methylase [Candidatus Dactylopiibacterium carminicum]